MDNVPVQAREQRKRSIISLVLRHPDGHNCQLYCCAGQTTAEEKYDQPQELFNETGVPIEPFNLNREREEGNFDAAGGYIPNNFPQVKDAWLEGIDGGTSCLYELSSR